MDNLTFRERVFDLLQRSRKAVRLYSSMSRHSDKGHTDKTGQLAELQISQWHSINHELVRELSRMLEDPASRKLAAGVFELRDSFFNTWKESEELVFHKHKELTHAMEHGDYIKCAVVSSELISGKARLQAAQAAHHELSQLIEKSKITPPPIELATVVASTGTAGKVIPFQMKRVAGA